MDTDRRIPHDVPPSPSSTMRSEDGPNPEAGHGSCTPGSRFSVPTSARSPVDTGARRTGTRRFFGLDACALLQGDLPTTPITCQSTYPFPNDAKFADNAPELVEFNEGQPQDVAQQPTRIVMLEPKSESGASSWTSEERRRSSVVRFMHRRRFSRITVAPEPEPSPMSVEAGTEPASGAGGYRRKAGSRRVSPGSSSGAAEGISRVWPSILSGLVVVIWTAAVSTFCYKLLNSWLSSVAPALVVPMSADCAEKRHLDGFDVVVLMGQSNMGGNGRGYNASIDGPNDPRIQQWSRNNTIVIAEERLQHYDYNSSWTSFVGMGTAFGRSYVETLPAHRDVLLVPTAAGASALVNGPWSPGGYLFEDAVERVNAALASSEAVGNCVAAILWHQGETDAFKLGVDQETYQSAWTGMIDTLRNRVPAATRAPVIVGEFSPSWVEENRDVVAPVVAAIRAIPDSVNFTAVASADNISVNTADILHFDAAGQRELGQRYFERLGDAIGNSVLSLNLSGIL